MKFKIKKVKTDKDWKIVLKINSYTLKGCDYDLHDLGTYWLIYHKNRAIGFFGCNEITTLPGVVFFNRVGIYKRYHGKGLHKKALQVRKNYAKKLGSYRLISYTHKTNLRSANNLEAFGFRIYTPTEYIYGKDMYYFHLFL